MDLNELKARAYKIASEHGWHDKEQSDETLLMLIITELAEAVEADRSNKHADVAKFKEWQTFYGSFFLSKEAQVIRFKEDFEAYIKDSVEDELADVVIRCLDFAGARGLDLHPISDNAQWVSYIYKYFQENTFATVVFYICKDIFDVQYENTMISEAINIIFRYCTWRGIDLEWHIEQKMEYNQLRPYKHGNKQY